MTTTEAIEHLEARKRLMEERYVDRYPKWTVADYCALSIVLAEIRQKR